MTVESIVEIFISKGWSIVKVFTLGHKVGAVYGLERNGMSIVLKVAITERELHEIRENYRAAHQVEKMGVGWFHPKVFAFVDKDTWGYLALQYAGEDYGYVLRTSSNCRADYNELLEQLLCVFQQSKKYDPIEAHKFLEFLIRKIRAQVEIYLFDLPGSRDLLLELDGMSTWSNTLDIVNVTFSQWDFTPEDTYVDVAGRITRSDLRTPVVGLPMIDLATFSGVCLAYGLPECEWAYKRFRQVAQNEVAAICEIDPETALKVFDLGRILQLLLSARFRRGANPTQGLTLYREAAKLIGQVHSN